jgi:hypothetical protein
MSTAALVMNINPVQMFIERFMLRSCVAQLREAADIGLIQKKLSEESVISKTTYRTIASREEG